MKRIGIDIGSTTIKIVAMDQQGELIFSTYQRHFSCIKEKLLPASTFGEILANNFP